MYCIQTMPSLNERLSDSTSVFARAVRIGHTVSGWECLVAQQTQLSISNVFESFLLRRARLGTLRDRRTRGPGLAGSRSPRPLSSGDSQTYRTDVIPHIHVLSPYCFESSQFSFQKPEALQCEGAEGLWTEKSVLVTTVRIAVVVSLFLFVQSHKHIPCL